MPKDDLHVSDRHTGVAIALYWLIAFSTIADLSVGYVMKSLPGQWRG